MKAKEYFTDVELNCNCNCGALPSQLLVDKITAGRIIYKKSIFVTSCARCKPYNDKIGGASLSHHLTYYDEKADAIDFYGEGGKNDIPLLISIFYNLGFKTMGIIDQEKGILHADLRSLENYENKDGLWLIY